VHQTAHIFIVAGSETTATLLSGLTYLLATNQHTLVRVAKEVREAFNSEAEINLSSVGSLPYLSACINEAMRLYPPVAIGMPRITPSGGATIDGHYVPENVSNDVLYSYIPV
jgi:cytochrome P450